MEIEVIVQGKGSITVKQEVDWTRKEIEKLITFSVAHINQSIKSRAVYGFEGGSQVQAEHAANWHVPAVSDIDSRVK